jgi:hypothetical protein
MCARSEMLNNCKITCSNLNDHRNLLTYSYDMYPPSMSNISRASFIVSGVFSSPFLWSAVKKSSVAADRVILEYSYYRPHTIETIEAINWEEEEGIDTFVWIKWGMLADSCHAKSLSSDLTVEPGTIMIQTSRTNHSVMMFEPILTNSNALNCSEYKTPLVRTLIIRIANFLDRLGPSGKFVENSTKPACLEIV